MDQNLGSESFREDGQDPSQGLFTQYRSGQPFSLSLTVSQSAAISRLLPTNYTLQIDRTAKHRKSTSRKKSHRFTENPSVVSKQEEEDIAEVSVAASHPEPLHTLSYDEMIRRAQKILLQLRKNKNSWPFLEPVDPIAMGIPHYAELIKDPMDLKTVGINLNEGKYFTITQFYADIELILKNSYLFNRANADFLKITQDFERYYEKLKLEPIVVGRPQPKPVQRTVSQPTSQPRPLPSLPQKTKSEPKSLITIAEKRELAARIKNLKHADLLQLGRLICEGDVPEGFELNLENMSLVKLHTLQDFIQKKERRAQAAKKESQEEEAESSFQSDSDS